MDVPSETVFVKFSTAPGGAAGKPFIFNVTGLVGGAHRAVVKALLESYPPLVRRVGRLATESTAADHGPGWVVCGAGAEETAHVASVDELEEWGREGWVCVQSTDPSPEGAGALRRVFGSRVFSVALLSDDEKGRGSETAAARYLEENPSVPTPDGEMAVFDLFLRGDDAPATTRQIQHLFESRFLDY